MNIKTLTNCRKKYWQKVNVALKHGLLAAAVLLTQAIAPAKAAPSSVFSTPVQETVTLSGKVVDDADGQPIPGITIVANKKALGSTDEQGTFSVKVAKGTSVSFEMLGYTAAVRVAASNLSNMAIRMVSSSNELNEVVVTALGIKREQKALGYSQTTVGNEQLTDALSNNWTDALSGKVAGLNLVRSNSGPSGSNKIILRGESNLTGDNDALIVVDGVVINHGSGRSTGLEGNGAYLSSDSPADYGSGINDINPEDIESVTVLKGPGASALYGQRGANGAIIITTKSGKAKQSGVGVSINSNTSIQTINRWPDLQYEYGQGIDGATYYSYNASPDGANTRNTGSAWGPKFDGQQFFQFDPITQTQGKTRTPWVPYEKDIRNFFTDGVTSTNSISIDGGSDKTTARFSATNVQNTWILPNTGYKRNTVSLSVNQKITDKFQISTRLNYTNKWSDNLPSAGYNNQSVMYWFLAWVPSAPVSWLKDYWMNGKEGVVQNYPFSSLPDNPYLITNEMLNKSNRHGITGNIQATYQFTKELNLMVRTSMDFGYEQRSQQRPYDTEKYKKGMYRTQNIFSQEASTDFMMRYAKKINKDFDISVSVGGSMLTNTYNKDENRADSLLYPGIYTLANAKGLVVPLPNKSRYALNSFFGLGTVAYKDFLFLDVTARNDWNSVLATKNTDNVSFFYPSVNASFILSEVAKLPDFINYTKFRASAAQVGSGRTTAYLTSYTYSPQPLYPGGLANPTTLPNLNLKPLTTISYEFGAEMKLLKNRLGFDLTYYTGSTKDQILSGTIDPASGGTKFLINAGSVQNSGIEVAANGSPIKKKGGLSWNINATFSANKNRVVSLTDSLSELILQNGPGSRGAIIARVGGSMGDLYGRGYERSPDGAIVYENGLPRIASDMTYMGNTNPKWKASISNEFRYKQFKLSFMLDGQYGSVAYSLSSAVMAEQGKSQVTLPGRYNGIIGDGVIRNADGTYRKNDVIAQDVQEYYTLHYGRDNVEGSTFSTDFIKLREARFDYTLTPKFTKRLGLQRAAIGVYGRDLFTVSDWPMFDPEFGTLSGADINRGFELGQFPASRTFGVNLVVGF